MKLLHILALIGITAAALAQEVAVDPTQLTAWQNFFDKTGGGSWTRCRNKRSSPCTCEGTTNALVQCTEQNGVQYITSIRLRNNNLAGVNVPGSELNAIMTASPAFTSLDIAANPNLRNTRGSCINIPACASATCRLDYAVCTAGSTTPSPSPASTVPTTSGSIVPSASPMSATTAPTPTTTAPSTATPATTSPSGTSTPTIFFPPSTPPAGTPTTSRPATSAPSATSGPSATAGPSTLQTKSPTAPTVPQTASPTAPTTTSPPVTATTGSPSVSAGVREAASNGALLVSCALAAFALA